MIPPIAFLGAGRVASTLARAFVRHGMPVVAIASRRCESAERLAAQVDGSTAVSMEDASQAPLVFMTVPDDDLGTVCSQMAWRAGQSVIHCSGATEIDVLRTAATAGATIGGFHPLQIFSDPVRAVDLLAGATVAIEGDAALVDMLRAIARRLDMRPITLPAGARAAYHGGASFAASFLVSMIEEAVTMWRSFGVPEADALGALMPLARGTIETVAARGVAGAVSGPISRGDVGVLVRHLEAFDARGVEHGRLYREMARRQIRLAVQDRRLDAAQAARVAEAIDARSD